MLFIQVLSSTELKFQNNLSNDISLHDRELSADVSQNAEVKSQRIKRSSWSLPYNTTARFIVDYIVIVAPLNNTVSYLVYDINWNFVLPTYSTLQTLYQTLGKIKDEDRQTAEGIDLELLEEQRANDERRSIYQVVEQIFKK